MTFKIINTDTISRHHIATFLKNKYCQLPTDKQIDEYINMLQRYPFTIICDVLDECKFFSKTFEEANDYLFEITT
jgi:hypothetical protein